MFTQYIDLRRTIDDAAQNFFADHPRTPANVAQVIAAHWSRYGFSPSRANVEHLRRITKVSAATFTQALVIALAQRRPEPNP